ncbi:MULTISPECIES: LysE/ArgO family amino acid transporter [Bifidobacterium]|uniref:LysE/ArgO family amino acid transporter n=1 Tax=Bifidobacterium TaxID=1678 RepID=UPI001BDCD212|nr:MULTISPECIES: LysE family transporter [Bifidobacterium]MBT1161453.1 LysE family transporter [Bifidobacterium sp. SO1]MBW3078980.1 LysE family transporter [Bifidobacterium simiiventris]
MGFYLQGLTMGLAYIAPIGMQNLFVINSALTRTRRNALITALIVICFDMALSLSCFFGVGALMQAHPALQTVVLGVGGLVVVKIGLGLVFPKKAAVESPASASASASSAHGVAGASVAPARHLGVRGLLDTIGTACAVTWFNPQAIIDGTLMLGAFSATLSAQESTPFITGVETASVLWFLTLTLVINAFAHRFSPKIIAVLNRVCGGVIALYGVKLLADFALSVL